MTKRNAKIGLIFLIMVQNYLFACWGARPLSMGGAFVSVADDIHSIYWNPAGLGNIEEAEITYTRLMNSRETASYDDFWAVAIPLKYGALGMSYTYDWTKKKMFVDNNNYLDIEGNNDYLTLGYGVFLNKDIAIGINLKLISKSTDVDGMSGGSSVSYSDSDTIFPLDFGLLWNINPYLTFGVLCQNFNEPVYKSSNQEEFFNLRPGISFRPNKDIVFSLEIYDLLDKSNGIYGRDISAGMEKRVNKHLSLRAGGYHINNSDKDLMTAGIGLVFDRWKMDYGIMSGRDISDATHWLSIGYSF